MTIRNILLQLIYNSKDLNKEPRIQYTDTDGDLHFLDISQIYLREDVNNVEIICKSEEL